MTAKRLETKQRSARQAAEAEGRSGHLSKIKAQGRTNAHAMTREVTAVSALKIWVR
jgi:hypothetical protein